MGTNTEANRRLYAASPRLRTVIDEVSSTLRGIFGERFSGLVLFGSYARGTAVQGSDVDLLLLLQDCAGISERRSYSKAIADLSLRYDMVISVVPMGVDEYRSGKTPFLLNVRREGVSL